MLMLGSIHKSVEDLSSMVENRVVSCKEDIGALTSTINFEGVLNELKVVKRAL